QDIMGTMSNTLVFAYLSGSMPIILLLLRNGLPITYIININLSLEFMRALIGSIGIVLSIPITIFTSIAILKKHKIGEA
ncbi:YibE/F family protein, partial [Clostridium beijerinckii]